jgi:hypothetical protein
MVFIFAGERPPGMECSVLVPWAHIRATII